MFEITVVTRCFNSSVAQEENVYGVLAMVDGLPYAFVNYNMDYQPLDDESEAVEMNTGDFVSGSVYRQMMIGAAALAMKAVEDSFAEQDTGKLRVARKLLTGNPIAPYPYRVEQLDLYADHIGAERIPHPSREELQRWLTDFQNGRFIRGLFLKCEPISEEPSAIVEEYRIF